MVMKRGDEKRSARPDLVMKFIKEEKPRREGNYAAGKREFKELKTSLRIL